ncbi:NAD(P)/FAD-dependent oxidoreductase [Terasakiella sp.]|uniref:NAD(P)/FAD-dependent oxidoreductase n=1 Tax=Terasakiella sp. TaxID=2034861 RepID=UPI003AA810B1
MANIMIEDCDVAIVGAGFTGLSAAFELSKQGKKVCVIEADDVPGGLAGTFKFNDEIEIEKFYHHWFNSDEYIVNLIRELGLLEEVVYSPSKNGMYYNGRLWKLSTPLDLLKFKALPFLDRIRLGLLVFQVRKIKDWKSIEHLSIREWLEPLCGKKVFQVVWEPLIKAKFSTFAEKINAVWMWKKLVLRGSTRDKKGHEELAYFKGGFGRLAENLVSEIEKNGSKVVFGCNVLHAKIKDHNVVGLATTKGEIQAKSYLFTPALPIIAKLFEADNSWAQTLRRVNYLGNMCLVLRLDRSLSETYWLNVNDMDFPFVGVIEHTNFYSSEFYQGSHIVYLSRYLSREDRVWDYSDQQYFEFAYEHLKRMFPELNNSWVIEYKVWRSSYAQPITERGYSEYVPTTRTPYTNAFISTMAQIYPEDRGTNYAVRDGRKIAKDILNHIEQ